MAYSEDLRVRLIGSVEQGRSARSQAKIFKVSASTAVKWLQAFRGRGQVAPKPHRGGRRSVLDSHRDWLVARVAEKSDITLKELSAELGARGLAASKSAVSRFFERIGFSFKKKRARLRAGSSRRGGGSASLARRAADARSKKAGVHR